LVPFIDLANHADVPTSNWYFNDTSDRWVLRASTRISSGHEVFDSYGLKSMAEMLLSYGFIPEDREKDENGEFLKPVLVQIPICLPPSLVGDHSEKVKALKLELLNVSTPAICCPDIEADGEIGGASDMQCFARLGSKWGANPNVSFALQLTLTRSPVGSEEQKAGQLAKALAHFRFLALKDETSLRCFATQLQNTAPRTRSLALRKRACLEPACFPELWTDKCWGHVCPHLMPISAENEMVALRLLRAVAAAPLTRHSPEVLGAVRAKASGSTDKREAFRMEMARRYIQAEADMLSLHVRLADFALPLLNLARYKDRLALQDEVCRLASTANMTLRWLLKDFAPYVDSVVAPLAIHPFPFEAPCSVVHNKHALTKACMSKEMESGVDRMIQDLGLGHLQQLARKSDDTEL